jgi:hypothetical protein
LKILKNPVNPVEKAAASSQKRASGLDNQAAGAEK